MTDDELVIALPPLAAAGVLILAYGIVRRRPFAVLAGAAAVWAGYRRGRPRPPNDT